MDHYPHYQQFHPLSPSISSRSSTTSPTDAMRKRASKDQGTSAAKFKQQRRQDSNADVEALSPPLTPQQDRPGFAPSSSTTTASVATSKKAENESKKKGGNHLRSIVSAMTLDDPLPMAHLNDSDLWSHSLQMTSERELPPKAEMDVLLNLYFRYMYPFAPLFIRKTFMERHRAGRPSLSQILLLNAMFCNACWYSDDPDIKQQSTKYFSRAKIILDETYHVSQLSTVQALLMMSHHQHACGNHSGGWLYTGMAVRIAHDLGLHRQDMDVAETEEAEMRKRVWWALYIADRLGGGIMGRPLVIRDKEFNVQMPNDDWILELGGEDSLSEDENSNNSSTNIDSNSNSNTNSTTNVHQPPFESERIISLRLLWSVKLFMQMGQVLNTMHCIEAEINGAFLADISRTQLPQLHNSLTSWFLSLPSELMYTPYTMSPNANHPPSPPTALVHMFYYTCLTMLHRPYLRPANSAAIDPNFLVSSRNICTAAATNVCHIADSLMLHGQLREICYYGMSCLLAAGTVHVHNAITPTPSNRETTRAGLSKSIKAAHELVKTFPVAESFIAITLDVFSSQPMTAQAAKFAANNPSSFIDISTFVAPLIDLTQLQQTVAGAGLSSSTIGNIYEAARLAKVAKDGPSPAPSIQLRHPYGNFSMPLPETTGTGQDSTSRLSTLWQSQIATAVAVAAIAFGGTDPLLDEADQQAEDQHHFFTNPLELPEALRLAPIDTMMFGSDPSAWDPLYLGTAPNLPSTTQPDAQATTTSIAAITPTVAVPSVAPVVSTATSFGLSATGDVLSDLHVPMDATMEAAAADELIVDHHPLLEPASSPRVGATSSIPMTDDATTETNNIVTTPRTSRLEAMMKDDHPIISDPPSPPPVSGASEDMDVDSDSSLSSLSSVTSSLNDCPSPASSTASTKKKEVETTTRPTHPEPSPPLVDGFSAAEVQNDSHHQSFMASLSEVVEDESPVPFFLDGDDEHGHQHTHQHPEGHGPIESKVNAANMSNDDQVYKDEQSLLVAAVTTAAAVVAASASSSLTSTTTTSGERQQC
ncbi:hypothetical protein BGZ83_001700 [Gryganskiella cystojenkinii]|nr:hypothetical protein BGZ83_001700 [Gryganskiella cystojenkinii]